MLLILLGYGIILVVGAVWWLRRPPQRQGPPGAGPGSGQPTVPPSGDEMDVFWMGSDGQWRSGRIRRDQAGATGLDLPKSYKHTRPAEVVRDG